VLISFTRTQTRKFPTSTSFPTYDTLVFQTCSANLSIFPIPAMATSEPPDDVESAASVPYSQGQPPLEPATTQQGTPISVLDTSNTSTHNRMTSETLGTFCDSCSEFDIEFSSCSVNFSSPKRRERTTSSSEQPVEAPTAIIKEGAVTMPEHSSLRGTRLDGSAVSISEHDLPNELPPHIDVSIPEDTASHQPVPSEITGELQSDANVLPSAVFAGTSEQLGRKGLLKGKVSFRLACVSARPDPAT
jgi:hypothetical protein